MTIPDEVQAFLLLLSAKAPAITVKQIDPPTDSDGYWWMDLSVGDDMVVLGWGEYGWWLSRWPHTAQMPAYALTHEGTWDADPAPVVQACITRLQR
jgi:hypothetical protein